MATPTKPATTPTPSTSNGVPSPATLKREAKAMLTACKDVERNIARYASPPDPDGLKLVGMQLRLLERQLREVSAGVEAVSR